MSPKDETIGDKIKRVWNETPQNTRAIFDNEGNCNCGCPGKPPCEDDNKVNNDNKVNDNNKINNNSWLLRKFAEFYLLADFSFNWWYDNLNLGTLGEEYPTHEKIQDLVYTYASGKLFVTIKAAGKSFRKVLKIPKGFVKIKGKSHGAPLFKHKKRNIYITPDVDSHSGGSTFVSSLTK